MGIESEAVFNVSETPTITELPEPG